MHWYAGPDGLLKQSNLIVSAKKARKQRIEPSINNNLFFFHRFNNTKGGQRQKKAVWKMESDFKLLLWYNNKTRR